jgi:biotin carboxylase
MLESCLILNRWDDDFARYERVVDHRAAAVAYVTTQSHARTLPPGLAKHVEVLDTLNDEKAVFAAAHRCAATLGRIDRLIAISEFDLLTAARLRERFAIPGYQPDDILRFRDKIVMKQAVAAANLRVPRSADLDDEREVASLVAEGFPLIVKPRKGAASQGCIRIDDHKTFTRECALRRGEDAEIETFVDGPILHVDGLVAAGALLFARASAYVNTCYDFANGKPLGSILLPSDKASRPINFAQRCLRALGLHEGAFHLELIDSAQGLVFLEVGARVGGGEIPFVMRDVYGVDLVADWLRLQLGRPPETIRAQANSEELGGFLMLPEPVGCRLIEARSQLGRVEGLYAEVLPAAGYVFDGTGGYDALLGRFRYRGFERGVIERAISETLATYRYRLEAVALAERAS